ncbi:MAG: PilZ domain-containing protein [Nannocystaceae bacterium]|nr:PilZ domain-containing protein [Nannocystaceae bacterium]
MAPKIDRAAERRAFARAPHGTHAVLSTGRGEYAANVLDLSIAGVRLEVRGPVDQGEFVRVRLPLSVDDSAAWIDPDALVVRTTHNATTGHHEVGLSFLELPRTTLRLLSRSIAASLSGERASNDPHTVSGAPTADRDAAKPQSEKPTRPNEFGPRAPQQSAANDGLAQESTRPPRVTHPAPPTEHKASRSPRKIGKPSELVLKLARLVGRRRNPDSVPAKPRAANSTPSREVIAQPSPNELRDLFRSAVASVDSGEKHPRKR